MNPDPLFSLHGKTALVTGSSRGIGAAIALTFARAGADLILHFAGNRSAAESSAEALRSAGARADLLQADLAAPEAAALIAHELARLGRSPDILVLNASLQERHDWLETTPEQLERHIRVNYQSSYQLCQRLVPAMKIRGWGRLLSIGSVQERRPHPEMLPYSSLKHAQTGLVLGLAKPLGPFGITANNLAPGVILTDRNSEALGNPDYAEQVQRAIPAKRFGQPSDCAGAALLLCSEAGAYITGQSLYVDGGLGLP
jgi:glucose 1-dehydrogenase